MTGVQTCALPICSSGIAVGLATNIPPHNLREAVNAVIAQIDNPDITVDELMKIMPAPDFPTGGVLLNTEELKNAYLTGKGKLLLRARTHVEDGTAGRKLIVITEVPYQVNKAAMLEKILKLSEMCIRDSYKGPAQTARCIRPQF